MLTAVLLTAIFAAESTEITGKVVSIADGDTCTVLIDREQVKVRLDGIDAPEKKQPFGTKSREHLAALIHEKQVRVVVTGKDRYGRSLGTIWDGKTNVNEAMVRSGLAWHYKKYSRDKRLAELEDAARKSKHGLWADKSPMPPWEWRAAEKDRASKTRDVEK
jgi:endonuclease YncB( thermonuclease family)